jgi:hypothetical protein
MNPLSFTYPGPVPPSEANPVCDPRDILEPPAQNPPEMDTMIQLWMESVDEDEGAKIDDINAALYEFIKSSSHPAAKAALDYWHQQQLRHRK